MGVPEGQKGTMGRTESVRAGGRGHRHFGGIYFSPNREFTAWLEASPWVSKRGRQEFSSPWKTLSCGQREGPDQ